jgi:eukaryotic-like serine/threonine-protein kinase
MDPERWKRIDALLSAALECEESQRAAFLSRACEGDEELRKEVQTLLSEGKAAGSFLQTPVAHVVGLTGAQLHANSAAAAKPYH